MKRLIVIIFAFIAIIVLIFACYVRFAPYNLRADQVDPVSAISTQKPNEYRVIGSDAPVFAIAAPELMISVDDFILSQPHTKRIRDDIGDGLAVYVQRSLLMGYPDYISVKVSAYDDASSKLEIYSRSRFGYSDLGVNRQRVQKWVSAITARIIGG